MHQNPNLTSEGFQYNGDSPSPGRGDVNMNCNDEAFLNNNNLVNNNLNQDHLSAQLEQLHEQLTLARGREDCLMKQLEDLKLGELQRAREEGAAQVTTVTGPSRNVSRTRSPAPNINSTRSVSASGPRAH